jgi:hypothetical protein
MKGSVDNAIKTLLLRDPVETASGSGHEAQIRTRGIEHAVLILWVILHADISGMVL